MSCTRTVWLIDTENIPKKWVKTVYFKTKRDSVLGISSMYDVLDMQTGIRACCALLAHYKSMGLSENDILLAYQEGLGNYQDVKQGKEEPWKAYYNVLKNIEIYSTLVKT